MSAVPPIPEDALWRLRRSCGYHWANDPMYGCTGDGSDETAKLAAAATAARNAGGILHIPPGMTIVYNPSGTGTYLRTWNNGGVVGGGPTSCIKVGASSGNYQAVFYDLGAGCSNFFFDNIRIDQNAANNDGNVQAGVASTSQFAVLLTGACTDVSFRGVHFDTCTGINTVWAGAGTAGSKNITLDRCYFSYKKTAATTSTVDNSAVYLGGRNLRVVGCTFYSGSYADCPGGACEFHGAPFTFVGNVVDGYQVPVWVAAQFFASDQDVSSDGIITGNTFSRVACGPRILCVTSAQNASPFVRNVTVANNPTNILQAGTHHDADVSVGISIDSGGSACTIDTIRVGPQTITFEADARSSSTRWGTSLDATGLWAGVYMPTLSGPVSNIAINDLTIVNAPGVGMYLGGNGPDSILDRVVTRNVRIIDAGRNTNLVTRSGVVISGALTDCDFEFELIDTSKTATPHGQYAWQVFPYSAATRTYFRPKPPKMSGSGALSEYWDFSATTLLGAETEGSESLAYTSAWTPNPHKGRTKYMTLLNGDTSVLALPTTVPSFTTLALKNQRLRFVFTQDSNGGQTVTFASQFKTSWTPSTTGNKVNVIDFECNGTDMIQTSAAVGL